MFACPHYQPDTEHPGVCNQCGNPQTCEYVTAELELRAVTKAVHDDCVLIELEYWELLGLPNPAMMRHECPYNVLALMRRRKV